MVKVAVPVFEGRVSPVFDTSMRLAYFDVAGGKFEAVGEEDISAVPGVMRPRLLVERSVSVLLCGGVSGMLLRALSASGIVVHPWLAGAVEDLVASFARGGLEDPAFRAPGCRRGRRGRGRRGGGRCRRGAGWNRGPLP